MSAIEMEHVFATRSLVHLFMWLKKLFPEPVPGAFTFDIFIADAAASSVRNQGDIYFMFFCFFDWARGDKQRIKSRSKSLNVKRAATLMAVCLQQSFPESLALRNFDLGLGICLCSPVMHKLK